VITTSDVIPLRTDLAALAFFGAGQLFKFTVKFFDLPAHVVRVLSDLRGQVVIPLISGKRRRNFAKFTPKRALKFSKNQFLSY
jgi:hypothetical protein